MFVSQIQIVQSIKDQIKPAICSQKTTTNEMIKQIKCCIKLYRLKQNFGIFLQCKTHIIYSIHPGSLFSQQFLLCSCWINSFSREFNNDLLYLTSAFVCTNSAGGVLRGW